MAAGGLRASLPRLARRQLKGLSTRLQFSSSTSPTDESPVFEKQGKPGHLNTDGSLNMFNIPVQLKTAQIIIDYRFKTPDILWESLQAPGSDVKHINGRDLTEGNKPLAGVGDKVFALVAVLNSYDRGDNVGATSSALIAHVGNFRLATVCDECGLTLCINKNNAQNGPVSPRTKADTVEAVIGAAYRDGGLEAARHVMKRLNLL